MPAIRAAAANELIFRIIVSSLGNRRQRRSNNLGDSSGAVGNPTAVHVFIFAPFLGTRNNKEGVLRLQWPLSLRPMTRPEIPQIQVLADGETVAVRPATPCH
jgi:hypothetical protein